MRDAYRTVKWKVTLKTLFNIVEAPFKKLLNFHVCVEWWYSDGPLNNQEYKSFDIYAVSIEISMTEYHHWVNDLRGISSSVLSGFFTDKFYKLLKSLHLIGWEQICQWKTLTKCLMKCPPGWPFILTQQSMGRMSMVFLVTCIFSLFWST